MAATNEDDDSWLYGAGGENHERKPPEIEENDKDPEEIAEDESELNTEAPIEDGEANSEGEAENGSMKDDGVDLDKNDESECKLDDIEEGMMENDMLDDGANAVLDESLADGEAPSQEDNGSDDDDSDDDVQVTIGDIKAIPSYGYGSTPVNLNIKRVAGFGAAGVPSSAKTTKGLDIDLVGNVNGVPLYDFNLDTMEDKPWRKPGADITDYFNYGFNEDSWKIYCERQRKLRLENNVSGKISVNHVTGLKDQLIPVASVNENSKYSAAVAINLGLKKAGPPPGRKLSGSIDVIGGGAPSLPSRRPVTTTKENVITVMTGRKFDTPLPGIPPPHLAPTHLPPPSFLSVPPEANLSIPLPPPGTILPPTNIPPPPPGTPFPDHFASGRYSVPPPAVGPMSGYEDHAGYYNGSTMSHGGTYDETTQQSWPSSTRAHSEAHRERDRRERSREREHERSYAAWDYREHETRERAISSRASVVGDEDYERTSSRRHREYHERSRDRERDRERERSTGYEREYERDDRYDRDRDRDRRHKDHRSEREDRHRERSSRRRHHHDHHESDEEYEHRSSRHKHKRSKRDKDDETSSNAPPSASESQDATELDLKQE